MAEKIFKLDIVAPDRILYKGRVQSFSAPGELGAFQVLYNHAPLLSSLVPGEMKFTDEHGNTVYYATSGGFVEVRDNRVLALVDTAERAEDIDSQRAKDSRKRAVERIKSRKSDIDSDRARRSLARAINRLRVARRAKEGAAVS
jgi:F-type H+-transporting ATPase subunit epsilon